MAYGLTTWNRCLCTCLTVRTFHVPTSMIRAYDEEYSWFTGSPWKPHGSHTFTTHGAWAQQCTEGKEKCTVWECTMCEPCATPRVCEPPDSNR